MVFLFVGKKKSIKTNKQNPKKIIQINFVISMESDYRIRHYFTFTFSLRPMIIGAFYLINMF